MVGRITDLIKIKRHLLTIEVALILLLSICSGCEQQGAKKAEVEQKKGWGSSRYSGAEEAWVLQNFYSMISPDLASIEYTSESKSIISRTDRALLQDSIDLARSEYGDAYRNGNIVGLSKEHIPHYVIVSVDDFEGPIKCAILLKFSDLFDPDLKLRDDQIIHDLPGRTNKEAVEKWKAAGEWQTIVDRMNPT